MAYFIKKYSKDGMLPNITRATEEGCFLNTTPSLPVDTPTNWTTLMTGADSFTHGVVSFTTHLPGELPQEGQYVRRTQHSGFSRAEFFWSTLERNGLKPAVLNYPVGWPPQVRDGFVIGGLTPGGDLWRISKPMIYSVGKPDSIANRLKGTGPNHVPIEVVRNGGGGSFTLVHDALGLKFACSFEEKGDPTLDMKWEGRELALAEGGWSPWLYAGEGERKASYRIKLHSFRPPDDVVVYVTQAFRASGWAHPAGLEEKVCSQAGPYVEGLETPYVSNDPRRPYGPSNLAPNLVLEHAQMQADWFVGANSTLIGEGGYDALIMHYHLIDAINHTYLSLLSRRNPAYDEKTAEEVESIFSKSYSIVDGMIGGLLERMDKETTVVITSDHSALPCWMYVSIESALAKAGLMKYERLPNGLLRFDSGRSVVFPYHDPLHLWVNLKGREKGGVVEPRDYDSTVEAAIDVLRSIGDPDKGNSVIKLAVRKSSWSRGASEDRFGDVLFFFEPGYNNWNGSIGSLRFDEVEASRLEEPVVESQEVGGHHTTYLPTETQDCFENHSFTIFSGRGVATGPAAGLRPQLRDVSPTIAGMLGIPAPRDSDGQLIYQILA